ncbi:LysR family transcriptional regulator [Nevskia sp.]|uniref:LysR family transcriptional regulator n=1 Tax=Nevskia sp. TaxID=1929292 RepID=UPI003F6F278D
MTAKRIDPHHLSVFLAIARHRNFRLAAIELGTTPSAVSHALRVLEARIGLRLVNRTTRSVALTEAGEHLQARVRPAFADIGEAIEDLNDFRGKPVGSLRINAQLQAARMVLMPIIAAFLEAYPGVRIELVDDDSASPDLVSGGYDAGVRIGERLAADVIAAPIGPARLRMAVVGAPDYFARHPVPADPRELRGLPCIRYRLRGRELYHWEFGRDGVALAVEVDGPLTLGSQELMLDAALAGAGLAYVFETRAAPFTASGQLRRVLADWCEPFAGFFLYYPNRRQHSAAFRAFLAFVRAQPAG